MSSSFVGSFVSSTAKALGAPEDGIRLMISLLLGELLFFCRYTPFMLKMHPYSYACKYVLLRAAHFRSSAVKPIELLTILVMGFSRCIVPKPEV